MRSIPVALSLILPTAALAHPGDHAGVDATHLLTHPDHLGLVVLGIVAALVVASLVMARGRR